MNVNIEECEQKKEMDEKWIEFKTMHNNREQHNNQNPRRERKEKYLRM